MAALATVPLRAQPPTDDVLVTVGDAPITRADLAAFERRQRAAGRPDDATRPPVAVAALERLVDERLLRAAIDAAGIEITAEQVNAAMDQLRAQVQKTSGIPLEKALERSGDDVASLGRRVEFDMAVARLIAPRVDAAAIAAAFARHRRDLDGTRVRASHVLLRPDMGAGEDALAAAFRRAADIRSAILERKLSFAEAAARHSAGPSRHRGGDLGFLERRGDVNETFAREAFSLAVGDVSPPFFTPFGVHLVTVTDIQPGSATLEQVRPRAESLATQHALRELIAHLRKTTPITYSDGVPRPGPGLPGGAADGVGGPGAGQGGGKSRE